jgi:lysine-N-methylase
MKLYAPKYYKNFACIADRCSHSCCVGWEIDVDEASMKKYASLPHPYGKVIRESIVGDEPHFCLLEDERCPHLDCRGLCRIITELGEGYLCDICREHPRFYHTAADRREAGLGLSCEEACRIILSSDGYREFIPIGETDDDAEELSFNAAEAREMLYEILSDRSVPYCDRLNRIASAYSLAPQLPQELLSEILCSLEYLEPAHGELLCGAKSPAFGGADEAMLERALAYFIFRHCSPARDEHEFRAALGFSLFCEGILRSLSADGKDIFEIARIISEELEYSEDNSNSIKTEFMF